MAYFKAYVFEGKRTAQKALDTLEDYTPAYVWVDDVALVSRGKHGGTRVHSTWAQDSDAAGGFGWGAVTGGLLGLLLGPAGAAVGAVTGGSLGALVGASIDTEFDDPRLDDFAAALDKDTSALILVGDESILGEFATALEPFGGQVFDTELDEKDVKAIKKALKS